MTQKKAFLYFKYSIIVGCLILLFFQTNYSLNFMFRNISTKSIASCMIQKNYRYNDKTTETEIKWIYDKDSLEEILTLLRELDFFYDSDITNIYYKSEIYHIRLFDINNNEYCMIEVVPEGNVYYNGKSYKLSKKYPCDYITSKLETLLSL